MKPLEQKLLSSIIIEPEALAKKTIIWLHGLGASGDDFVPIVPELKLPPSLSVRFIFPHAPVMAVTINSGYEMPAWYDILSLSMDGEIDHEGIAQSVKLINQLIEQEKQKGILTKDIVLAGFSQGAVI